jgi:hypothetical protein
VSIQLAVGVRVFVCSNLCFSGDLIALKRRHTKNLDLRREISDGLDRYQDGVLSLKVGIGCLQRLSLTESEAKGFVYDIFRKKVVPVQLFHAVTESYHATCGPDGRITAWGLHNCFTDYIKTLAPAPAFRATTRLGRFFSLR